MKDHDRIEDEAVFPTCATSAYVGPSPQLVHFQGTTKPKPMTLEEKAAYEKRIAEQEQESKRRAAIRRERNRKWWQK